MSSFFDSLHMFHMLACVRLNGGHLAAVSDARAMLPGVFPWPSPGERPSPVGPASNIAKTESRLPGMLYGALQFVELAVDLLLGRWLPFYLALKLAGYAYLASPGGAENNGGSFV